ncbi:MAG TPA: DMT family transporter [Rhizobiaceae bacterium]
MRNFLGERLAEDPVLTRLQANMLLLLAAAFWGFGNVAQKTVLQHLDPLSAVGLRCLVGALLVAPFALAFRRTKAVGFWMSVGRVAALFSLAILLQQHAYIETTVTNASFLVNTATVMTPLAAWLLFGERPALAVVAAAVATLFGVLLIAGELTSANPGDLFALASAVFYALWMVELGRHMRAHGDAPTTSAAQFALAALLALPIGIAGTGLSAAALAEAAPKLVGLGFFSTALAFGIQTAAQRFTPASHAAVIVSAESVFGAAGGALFLGERLSASAALGAAIVLGAILLLALTATEAGSEPAGSRWSGGKPRRPPSGPTRSS